MVHIVGAGRLDKGKENELVAILPVLQDSDLIDLLEKALPRLNVWC